jgi:hypothetical protein
MKITVKVDGIDATVARLRGLADKKIKAATVAALNDAAYAGSQAVKKEIQRAFDRPTPFILRSVVYYKAGLAGRSVRVPGAFDIRGAGLMNKLDADRMEAIIDLSGEGNKQGVTPDMVLKAQINAGERRHKRHEVALRRALILPEGMSIVPGDAAILDQFGNMSSGQIVQIIAWFRGFEEGGKGTRANMTDRTRAKLGRDRKSGQRGIQYFALQKKHGKLLPGIYQRIQTGFGSAVKPVMIFVRAPKYERKLDFYGVANKAALAKFDQSFPRYLKQMLDERGL